MIDKNIFQFNHYVLYLNFVLSRAGQWGAKTRLAEFIGVQPTYISQVLQEKAHLSLEQAELTNKFFQHTLQESHFFLLLVQKDRSGTKSLKEYFQKQIEEILKSRMVLVNRLSKVDSIGPEDRSWYYSSWLHAAFHIALTLPSRKAPGDLAEMFQVPSEKALEILERLEALGLAVKSGTDYIPSIKRIRLSRDHHEIIKHHTNWRLQAIQSLELEKIQDMHYSAVVSLSNADALAIKDLLLDAIQRAQKIIQDSSEEKLCVLNMDFFQLIK